jgi:hypothetical protein
MCPLLLSDVRRTALPTEATLSKDNESDSGHLSNKVRNKLVTNTLN